MYRVSVFDPYAPKRTKYWKVYCENQIALNSLSTAKHLNVYGVGTSINHPVSWGLCVMNILPVSCTGVDRESFPVKGTAGQTVMLFFVWELQTCRSNRWRCNRSSRPPRLRRSFSHHCYKGAWIRIRWKYWPSSFPLSHYSMNGIDYIAILQTGSTGHFTLFWFVVKAHNFDGFGLVQCPPVFPIRTPVFKLSLLSRLHHELPAVWSASWAEEIHDKEITDLNQRGWFRWDLIECQLLELQQS